MTDERLVQRLFPSCAVGRYIRMTVDTNKILPLTPNEILQAENTVKKKKKQALIVVKS